MAKIQSGDPTEIQAGMEDLPTLTSDFLELSEQTSGSFSAYQNDFAYVMRILNESEQIAGDQKSTAELSLEELESQTEELEAALDAVNGVNENLGSLEELESEYNAAQSALDESWYQDEIDRLTEINDSVLGLTEAQSGYFDTLSSAISAGFSSFESEYNNATSNMSGGSDSSGNSGSSGSYEDLVSSGFGTSPPSGMSVEKWAAMIHYKSYSGVDTASYEAAREALGADGVLSEVLGATGDDLRDKYSFAGGGTVTGPDSGYFMPTTFHGTEHITPDSQMQGVKEVLTEVRDLLISIRDTDGNINKLTIKTNRILDRVTQGGNEIRTKEIA
jgi:hypothetical protein